MTSRRVLLSCAVLALLSACATSNSDAVSTIPWEARAQMDGMGQQYGLFEDSYMYDGMLAPEPLSYENF